MKIAIVGSGIAGLTCAYLLNRRHDIQVFEASDWIGGHTHTVDVQVEGRNYAIDTGFIVFNDWTYPNFIRLLEQIGVGFKPTEMSFSVSDPATGVEYNGHDLNTLFAQRSNLLSPAFWGMLRDILRFNRQSLDDLANNRIDANTTLSQYLQRNGYGRRFIEHYIVPMGSAIWSMSLADMLGFPLQFFVRFCKNHGLLSVSDRPTWQVIEGGSRSYVAPLTASFAERIRLNCPVSRVVRDQDGVTLHSAAGAERFDKVIFACHSDQALALLEQPSEQERDILGALPSVQKMLDVVTRHTDFNLHHMEDFGLHYARTLRLWHDNLRHARQRLEQLGYDDYFYRLWEFYLCYCEGGFLERTIGTAQLLLAKPGARPAPLLGNFDA